MTWGSDLTTLIYIKSFEHFCPCVHFRAGGCSRHSWRNCAQRPNLSFSQSALSYGICKYSNERLESAYGRCVTGIRSAWLIARLEDGTMNLGPRGGCLPPSAPTMAQQMRRDKRFPWKSFWFHPCRILTNSLIRRAVTSAPICRARLNESGRGHNHSLRICIRTFSSDTFLCRSFVPFQAIWTLLLFSKYSKHASYFAPLSESRPHQNKGMGCFFLVWPRLLALLFVSYSSAHHTPAAYYHSLKAESSDRILHDGLFSPHIRRRMDITSLAWSSSALYTSAFVLIRSMWFSPGHIS